MKYFWVCLLAPLAVSFPSAWFWTVALGFVHLNVLSAVAPVGWLTLWPFCLFFCYTYMIFSLIGNVAKEMLSD